MKKKTKAERMIEHYMYQYIKFTRHLERAKKLKMKDNEHVYEVIRAHVRDEIEFWGGPRLD